ncbi:major pollen allergen Lig v 1 [Capsicum annuum]
MEKSTHIMLIASIICSFSLVGISDGSTEKKEEKKDPLLVVQGRVYCDPCRAAFLSNLSEPLPGAGVQLQCHQFKTKKQVLSIPALTNSIGSYRILLEGNHSDESCAVFLKSSPRKDCNTFIGNNEYPTLTAIELYGKKFKNGQTYVTEPLRFLTKEVSSKCSPDWDRK